MAGGQYLGTWGNLGGEVRGVVTYGISPNRQRAYAGALKGAQKMLTKRIFGVGWVLAGFVPWYLTFQYFANAAVASTRKNPNDDYIRSRGY